METQRHTNLSYLREIANGNDEFISDMIRIFSHSAPRMIAEMESYLDSGNWAGIKIVAHKLKPGIASMGIHELESDIHFIEDFAARQVNLEQLPELINRVRVVIFLSISELQKQFR